MTQRCASLGWHGARQQELAVRTSRSVNFAQHEVAHIRCPRAFLNICATAEKHCSCDLPRSCRDSFIDKLDMLRHTKALVVGASSGAMIKSNV